MRLAGGIIGLGVWFFGLALPVAGVEVSLSTGELEQAEAMLATGERLLTQRYAGR